METGMVFVLALCYINVFCELGNCHYWGWHELLCNFTKYYSCEISLNVNFNQLISIIHVPCLKQFHEVLNSFSVGTGGLLVDL